MSIEVEAYPKRITQYEEAENLVASDVIYSDNSTVSGRGSKKHQAGDIKIIDTTAGYEYTVRRRPISTEYSKKNGNTIEKATSVYPGGISVMAPDDDEMVNVDPDDIQKLTKWAGITSSLDELLTEIYETMIHIDEDGKFYALVEEE